MATLVSFHAHPDDESILTGGTLAKAADAGHRVVLVVATRGECGEVEPGVLEPGEPLEHRRVAETMAAAQILGVARVEFLGYRDSGMMGEPTNDDPDAFWRARIDDAATRLADILREEQAEVLTIYDANGGYGHPDHIQVHRVGTQAARLAGTPRVYQATINRTQLERGAKLLALMRRNPLGPPGDSVVGVERRTITTVVNVSRQLKRKRAAMAAHRSQIGPKSPYLRLPAPIFAVAFGREWFVRTDSAVRGEKSLFASAGYNT